MDEYQHMERFGMEGDFEDGQWINGEFYYRKRKEKRSQTREDVLFGVFAESDSDGDDSSRKRRRDLLKKPDLTKPVNFVSTGTVIPNQEIDKNTVDERNEEGVSTSGLGSSGAGLGFGKDGSQKRGTGDDDGDGDKGDDEDVFLPTAFGRMIMEGAERRRLEKEREKHKADKKDHVRRDSRIGDVGGFERHTKGIGLKLLEKMGYKGGGLGKNEQGIVAPIEARLRPKNMGMGFGEAKENKFSLPEEQPEVKKVVPAVEKSKEKLWLKDRKAKKKKEYITPEELLTQKEEEGVQFVQKVLDMRGPQVRVLTNLDNLNAEQEAVENGSFQPELQHNMRLIVDGAASDVLKLDRDLQQEKETAASLLMEKKKVEKEVERHKNMLDNMENIVKVLDKLDEENASGNLTLDMATGTFEELQRKYVDDYKLYDLAVIACSYAFSLLLRVFQGWDLLQNPSYGVEVMRSWKNLLQGDDPYDFSSGMVVTPYTQLSMEVVLPAVRISGTNTWNARDPEPMMRFLELWEKLQLMPPPVLQSILDDVVMPKLSEAVESWDPRRERIPIHQWIHPWLLLLGQKLEVLYHTIRFKLGNVLHAWHPSDESAFAILSPWQSVFDAASWEELIVRYIVPKLRSALLEFQVNPAHQELDRFNWVMKWASAIPIHHMVVMLETCFFPKWHQVLYHWLCSNPIFDEVTEWFSGWKGLFPENLRANERIRALLNHGLHMMEQASQGLEVPGARESVSYLRVTEQRQFESTQAKAAAFAQRDSGTGPEMSLKQTIETFAQDYEVVFKPKFGRTHNGLQVYGFGSISICVDSVNKQLFAQTEEGWRGVSLKQVLDMHRSGVGHR